MAGIISYGAYIPYYRMPQSVIGKAWGGRGGRAEKAIANADEDVNTMAVAAGMDCLKGTDPKTIDALFLGTTCAPYKERQNATIVAAALDLRDEARTADFTNSLRAGTTAMLSALDAVNAGSCQRVLVTAADTRLGAPSGENEMGYGDGAAALLFGNEGVAVEIEGSYSLSEDFPDHWRAYNDTFVRSWEDRFGIDEGYMRFPVQAAAGVLKKLKLTPKDITKACYYGANSRRHGDLARRLGLEPTQVQESLLEMVGNTGTAHPLMVLVGALEDAKPGDRILLVSYGSGSDAIVLKVTKEIEKIRDRRAIKKHLQIKKTMETYEKYLRWRGIIPLEGAARPDTPLVSGASIWRENKSNLPLYGVKCKVCGTPQLFRDDVSTRAHVCVDCLARDQFEPYRFADKVGKVVTFSHDYLAAVPDPPQTLTVVDFEGGGRGAFVMSDRDPDECKVGMMVEMTFRKIFFEKGVHNYTWTCKPVRG